MANTDYPVNHPLAVKLWAKKLMHDVLPNTFMGKFMSKSSDAMLQIKDETNKMAGDTIYCGLRMALTGTGVSGDNTLEGNEESLVTHRDSIVIDQLRNAVRSKGKMSEQRVSFDLREEARAALADWFAERIDVAVFNQLGGNTGQADTRYTGSNATVAPDTNHICYPNGTTTEAQVASASASNVFNLKFIDLARERASTLHTVNGLPNLRPIRINGENKYVVFLHPYQVYDIRTNTNSGQWNDIQKAAMQGGQISNNPIYTGALGEYNNCILHESLFVPSVTAGVYRAIFCGAQAGIVAFGRDYSNTSKMNWVEDRYDYENQLGVSAGLVWGVKKTVYNSADFGTIVIPTYAAAH